MSKIKEAIVEAALPIIRLVGKAEMEVVLQNVKDHNAPDIYQKTLMSLYTNFSLLKEAAIKTKTRIDEGIVDLILDAVKEKAISDQIVLAE